MNSKRTLLAASALAMAIVGGAAIAHGNMSGDRMHGSYGMGQGMGPGMMMGMSPGSLSDEELDLMGEQIRDMHLQMTRIAQSEDAAERRELVRQHLSAMQGFMQRRMNMHQGGAGQWRDNLEERVRHMEEMMKQQ